MAAPRTAPLHPIHGLFRAARALHLPSLATSYARGAFVFAEGGPADCVHLLESGLVRRFRTAASGEEVTLGYVRPGEVFGEFMAAPGASQSSFAQALRRSNVWRIPRQTFANAVAEDPTLGLDLLRQVDAWRRRIERHVVDLAALGARARVARALLELADDFGVEEAGAVALELPMTQGELATLVGMSRQTVSTELGALAREGLICRRARHVEIDHPERLRAIADGMR